MCSYYKYVIYSKDWWLFKSLDQWGSKGFVAINFSEYFKSTKEKLYSKLNEEQNLRKVAKSLFIFLTTPIMIIMILNLFDPEFQLADTKPMIKNKLK